MHEPLLDLQNLSLQYANRRVLHNLSLSVGRGQAIGLLGPNGSGKSSAITALVGTAHAKAERFAWNGETLPLASPAFRKHIGVVLQNASTDPKLSARQNLRLVAKLYGLGRAVAEERIREWLEFTELQARADEPLGQLSGGMRRRVEFIRALLHEPALLLLDEPTTGFDEHIFQKTWNKLQEIRSQRQLAILVSTHRPEEAERCDRIVILNQGGVVAEGRPAELRTTVQGDVIELEGADLDALAGLLRSSMNLESRRVADKLIIEHTEAHRLIPRIIEGLPAGRLQSVSLHRPTLADVFVHLTGDQLTDSERASS